MGDPPKRPRRALSPEDERLWERVASSAVPLGPKRANSASTPPPELPASSAQPRVKIEKSQRPAAPTRAEITQVSKGWSLAQNIPDVGPVGRPAAGLDSRTADRIRRGLRRPDSTLDLHGMTVERAHNACMKFLAGALARGDRMVLVITGKGGREKGASSNGSLHGRGKGVLRDSFPSWLRATPLAHRIVGIYEAHQRHGGAGAFYVYLKKQR